MRMLCTAAMVGLFAAPLAAVDCATVPGNLITPCGFESAPEVAAWTLVVGDSAVFAAGLGENGGALRADANLFQQQQPSFEIELDSPCFPVSGNTTYREGLVVREVTGNIDGCLAFSRQFSDNSCTTFIGSTAPPAVLASGTYQALEEQFTTLAGAQSARLRLVCFASQDGELLVDNAFAVLAPSIVAVPALGPGAMALLVGLLCVAGLLMLGRGST